MRPTYELVRPKYDRVGVRPLSSKRRCFVNVSILGPISHGSCLRSLIWNLVDLSVHDRSRRLHFRSPAKSTYDLGLPSTRAILWGPERCRRCVRTKVNIKCHPYIFEQRNDSLLRTLGFASRLQQSYGYAGKAQIVEKGDEILRRVHFIHQTGALVQD